MRGVTRFIGWAAILAAVCACGLIFNSPQLGTYRAVLQTPSGELPFQLDLAKENDRYVLYVVNGTQRLRLSEVELAKNTLTARFPGFDTTLRAAVKHGHLDGSVVLANNGGEQTLPFQADYGKSYRFFDQPASDNADFSGTWDVSLVDPQGNSTRALAEFQQAHDRVSGTFMTPAGDHGFLVGQAKGDELLLSTFSGGQAHLYKARVDNKGEVQGEHWSETGVEHWHAKRNSHASLEDIAYATRLAGNGIFNFTFPNLDRVPLSLSDMRFQGKVVLVTLAGSWSQSSHDEAAVLTSLYEQYRERGLEIVSLMFERSNDFDHAASTTRRFREQLGIEYTTLIAGLADVEAANKMLPALDRVQTFPTTLFIDRQGLVRRIHTGFSGPATGVHYEQIRQDYRALVEQLLTTSEGRREAHNSFRYASIVHPKPVDFSHSTSQEHG